MMSPKFDNNHLGRRMSVTYLQVVLALTQWLNAEDTASYCRALRIFMNVYKLYTSRKRKRGYRCDGGLYGGATVLGGARCGARCEGSGRDSPDRQPGCRHHAVSMVGPLPLLFNSRVVDTTHENMAISAGRIFKYLVTTRY
ncbi:hypothetical protein AAMO2058_000699300 [Amorphochlora amoebiformis]